MLELGDERAVLVGQDTHWVDSLFRRMLPDGSTEPLQQGVTIVVVSICSMIAGPAIRLPTPSDSRL